MPVKMTVEGAVATVTLNRPEKMNALTWEMREKMRTERGPCAFRIALHYRVHDFAMFAHRSVDHVVAHARSDLPHKQSQLQAVDEFM